MEVAQEKKAKRAKMLHRQEMKVKEVRVFVCLCVCSVCVLHQSGSRRST